MKRYGKFVLEAEKGITYEKFVFEAEEDIIFEVLEETRGELTIRAYPKYTKPPIPEGYKHIGGEWNNGFVIERCSDGSQFVWIPVGSLPPNGTLDGKHFSEKFGRRNYRNDIYFSEGKYCEPLKGELLEQIESVNKYGGFYISRYNISMSSEGKPQSVRGVKPWVKISFKNVKKIAATIENNEAVKSHLTFGAEYDSVLEWFIGTRKTFAEIAEDSTKWGYYMDRRFSMYHSYELKETGGRLEYCVNNIYDLAGNVSEWTQEQFIDDEMHIARGGNYRSGNPVAHRSSLLWDRYDDKLGFRAALYIK